VQVRRNVKLKPYTKQSIKWLVISLALFVLTAIVSQMAWMQMMAGAGYALAFTFLIIICVMAAVTLCISIYYAIITMS
jgi:hypothetical protein